MKFYQKKTLIVVFVTLVAIFSGAVNWLFQFSAIGVIYFIGTIYLLKQKTNNPILVLLLLILPFTFLYGYAIFNPYFKNQEVSIHTLPIFLMPAVSTFLGYVLPKKTPIILTYVLLMLGTGYLVYPNWLSYAFDDENPINKPFPEMAINDVNGNTFHIKEGKVIVLDLWATNCGICIKEFPDFEKLIIKYKNNTNVDFYTLNLPVKSDSSKDVKSYVNRYKFESLFAEGEDSWKQLENQTVPKLLIIDKSMNIVYKGDMNNKWYHFYNNIDDLIEKYSNE